MPAKRLDGRALSQTIKDSVKQQVQQRQHQGLPMPQLDVILVGNSAASLSYIGHKQRACKEVGIRSTLHSLPADSSTESVAALIQQLNQDDQVNGILLQLPLPNEIESQDLLTLIDPLKDVDGFHPYNFGCLALRQPTLRPCTPFGVMNLLDSTGEDLIGKHAVVVGASNIVGRPMALELLLAKCTVTVCHRFTQNLASHVQSAEILISATGKAGIIQSDWIRPRAMVIDVGFSRLDNGIIHGDIDYATACQRASWITPVPGGVGPMTVASLLQNTIQAAELQDKI